MQSTVSLRLSRGPGDAHRRRHPLSGRDHLHHDVEVLVSCTYREWGWMLPCGAPAYGFGLCADHLGIVTQRMRDNLPELKKLTAAIERHCTPPPPPKKPRPPLRIPELPVIKGRGLPRITTMTDEQKSCETVKPGRKP
jgi:hypothetical protein